MTPDREEALIDLLGSLLEEARQQRMETGRLRSVIEHRDEGTAADLAALNSRVLKLEGRGNGAAR
jgi:hypothetical protein